ncbi:MAG: putative quinol monooxygenase [Candidatus Izemoplasmatales bacterium]
MNDTLALIVKFDVKNDQIAFVKSELMKILEPTRNEVGCMLYELHQDLEHPNIFMFYEIWETKDAWKAHDKKQHIIDFKKAIEDSVNDISFNKLKML